MFSLQGLGNTVPKLFCITNVKIKMEMLLGQWDPPCDILFLLYGILGEGRMVRRKQFCMCQTTI